MATIVNAATHPLMRGAIPTPADTVSKAVQFSKRELAVAAIPDTFISRPSVISFWGNDRYGDCVTAEEAFAKACHIPEIFISDEEAIGWAQAHGYRDGAVIVSVLATMQHNGFANGPHTYNDGPYAYVDWTAPGTVRSAIFSGPLKIGVAADQLEQAWRDGDGNTGWFGTGFHADGHEDHCVSLCGYGTLAWLAQQLGVSVPSGVDGSLPGYALFTWNSIGIVDHASMVAITHEAWIRQPTTVIASQFKIEQSAGAITVDGGRPYIFALGSDGNLWSQWWDGSNWHWNSQGKPDGITLGASMGAITVDGGRPYIFALGSDGNLWSQWWDGSNWHWSSQGKPDGVMLGASMGAITVDGGRPYIFALGSDGNLWSQWWDGSNWHWNSQGKPDGVTLGASMGAITVDGGRPYIYVLGSDNNLWSQWWDGSNWHWSAA